MTIDVKRLAEEAGFGKESPQPYDAMFPELQAFANLVLERAAEEAEKLPVPYGVGELKEIHAHDMACVDCGNAIRALKS